MAAAPAWACTSAKTRGFSRIDSQDYNADREIIYYELDTEIDEIERRVVPSLPDEEVFVENAFGSNKSKGSGINFTKLSEVLAKFKKQSEGENSLLKVLEELKCPPRLVQQIKYFHEISGVIIN